jgi:hypothetical protein
MPVITAKNPRIVQDNLYANWHPWKINEFCGFRPSVALSLRVIFIFSSGMMYQKAIDPNEFLKQMKAKQEQEEVY